MLEKNNDKNKVKPISYFATYLRGHPRYPGDENIGVYIHPEQLELAFKGHSITIPYKEIKNIINVDKGKVYEGGNIALFGPFGLLIKRKVNATVIEYNETETSEIRMVALDFWANTKYALPIIYERMTNAQHISLLPISSNVDSNKPTISIVSKLSENMKRENQIIGSNKDNDNVSKSKMPISIPSQSIDEPTKSANDNDNVSKSKMPISIPRQPVNKTGQAPNKSPSNQIADSLDTPLTNSNDAKMNYDQLLQILKMRLVKEEISKEEYLELRKSIES